MNYPKVQISTSINTKLKTPREAARIALCFCGEPRFWEYGYKQICFFKEIYPEGIIDVFIHTWNSVTYKRPVSPTPENNIKENNIELSSFIDTYQPKSYKIEHKDVLDPVIRECDLTEYSNEVKYTSYSNLSQVYSTGAVHKIRMEYEKQNNVDYDIVFHTRTDLEVNVFYDNTNSKKYIYELIRSFLNARDIKSFRFPHMQIWTGSKIKLDHNIWCSSSSSMNVIFSNWNIKELISRKTELTYATHILNNNFNIICPLLGRAGADRGEAEERRGVLNLTYNLHSLYK